MSESAEVKSIGLAPRVQAIGLLGSVEGPTGILHSLAGIVRSEQGFGKDQAQVDGVFSKAASVGQEDASFSFSIALRVVAKIPMEFASRVEAAELEFYVAGAVGESAGLLQIPGGLDRLVRNQ